MRFIKATAEIRANRTVGFGRADDEILRQNGFLDACEYWKVALAQEMEVPEFVRLLETHLLDPARTAEEISGAALPIEMSIVQSLQEAFENGEGWLFQPRSGGNGLKSFRLRPREAAEWLLARPLDRDRVPDTLRACLELGGQCDLSIAPRAPGATAKEASPRKRGRKPEQISRVKLEMRAAIESGEMKPSDLEDVAEKRLETRFKASRDTCRKARTEVLLEYVENSNTDKLATNDK